MKSSEAMTLAVMKESPEVLVPVVQTMDTAIRRINHYPVDKH